MLEARRVPGDNGEDVARSAAALRRRHRLEVAELGAVARMTLEREEGQAEVEAFALDDEKALAEAAPKRVNGGYEFDPEKLRAWREAIVRNCMAQGVPLVVIILGAAHDLTEAIKAQAPDWGYTRITTRKVAELTGK